MPRKLPASVITELKAIEALTKDRNGPIADTYDRLQGVVFLKASRASGTIKKSADRMYIALHQSQSLAFFNITKLLKNSRDTLSTNPISHDISMNLLWANSILRIVFSLQNICIKIEPLCAPGNLTQISNDSANSVIVEISEFDKKFAEYIDNNSNKILSAISDQNLMTPLSSSINSYKILIHQLNLILKSKVFHPKSHLMNEDFLKIAVNSIDTYNHSYISQFRLLHQIPEMLSFDIVKLFDNCIINIELQNYRDTQQDLFLLSSALEIFIECLWPLINLMTPSQYHKIRKHLGVTSGSKSIMISDKIMSEKYLRLSRCLSQSSIANDFGHPVNFQLRAISGIVSKWRELHHFLPWSLLGTGATSLIGSKNASDSVMKMVKKFNQDDPLSIKKLIPQSLYELPMTSVTKLIKATGGITQRRFPDVENRAGIFNRLDEKK